MQNLISKEDSASTDRSIGRSHGSEVRMRAFEQQKRWINITSG